MKKLFMMISCLTMLVGLSGCSVPRTLSPLETDKPMDGAFMAGKWQCITFDKDKQTQIGDLDINWNQEWKKLTFDLYNIKPDGKEPKPGDPTRLLPLKGTLYELDGECFLNLTIAEKALEKILAKSGYGDCGLLVRSYMIMKVKNEKEMITLSLVDYDKQHPRYHENENAKVVIGSVDDIREIFKNKAYKSEPLFLLKRVPAPTPGK